MLSTLFTKHQTATCILPCKYLPSNVFSKLVRAVEDVQEKMTNFSLL